MQIASSTSQALVGRLSEMPEGAAERVRAVAQVSMLRKVAEIEGDMVRTLLDGVGSRLDVRG